MPVARSLRWALFVWVALVLVPASAWAGPLRLRAEAFAASVSGTETYNGTQGNWVGIVLTDNGAGDAMPQPGMVTYVGMLGTGTIAVTSGISRILTDPIETAELHLDSVNVQLFTAGTVRLTLEDTGISLGSGPLTAISSIGGVLAPGGTLEARTWLNTTGAVPDLGPNQSTSGVLAPIGGVPGGSVNILNASFDTAGGLGFSGSDYETFVANGPYSLFSQVYINFAQAGTTSFNLKTLVPVPEPGTLMLFGTGLIGAARLARRRFAAEPKA